MQPFATDLEIFHEEGWVVIERFLSEDELDRARDGLACYYPSVDEYYDDPSRFLWLQDGMFGGVKWFPFEDAFLTAFPFQDRVVTLAENILGHRDIRFLRANLQAKYAGAADYDQPLHFDYPNHNILVPGFRPQDRQLGFFVYFSDVTESHGPTHLVSKTHSRNLPIGCTHFFRDEASASGPHFFKAAPELYEVEQPAVGSAGSLLIYDLATLHRSSRMTAATGTRLTLSFAYGGPGSWQGYQSMPRLGEDEPLRQFIMGATPRQLELLGFPPVGDAYWTADTIERVAARYPGLDLTPHQQALK